MSLQAIPPESSLGNGKTPLLADWHGFGAFLALFRLAPRGRCPSLTPGPNCTKLGSGKIPVLADYPNFPPWSNFWRFFGRLQDDAVLRLPLDRITPNSVSCVFAGHSTRIEPWKRKDTIISRLARFWRFFGAFSAGSKTTLPFAYPWTELHQTRFLGLLQAISPELGVGSGKIPVLADYPNFPPWSNF